MTEAHEPFSQRYDINALVNGVATLLANQGITPHWESDRAQMRSRAAMELLSGFSVSPTLAPEKALDLDGSLNYDRVLHGD
jgi:hypothetical protein